MSGVAKNRAVFLDRDGTLIRDAVYIQNPEDLEWMPGTLQALRQFRESGYLLIIVTNQSGIGRGFFSEREVDAIHARMREDAAREGVAFDGIYFCPHVPTDGCDCRKPAIGLILDAVQEHAIDLQHSWFIGDACSDIEAGTKAGMRTVRLGSVEPCMPAPTYYCETIDLAVSRVLAP